MKVKLTANGLQSLPHMEDRPYHVSKKLVRIEQNLHEVEEEYNIPTHYELDGKHLIHGDFIKPLL